MSTLAEIETNYTDALAAHEAKVDALIDSVVEIVAHERALMNPNIKGTRNFASFDLNLPLVAFRHPVAAPNVGGDWESRIAARLREIVAAFPTFRGMLETRLLENTHGPALAALDDEKETWDAADAALRTAIEAMQTAGEFPSSHAFDLWFRKVAPPDAVATPGQRRESESVTVETILSQAQGLSHDAYTKLYKGVSELSSEALDRELAGMRAALS